MLCIASLGFSCSDDKPETRLGGEVRSAEKFLETVTGNYWVNEELYTCKRENGQTVRLTGDLWRSLLGSSQRMFLFLDQRTVRVYGMVIDPAFVEKYGDVMVYADYAFSYDEANHRFTLEGYDEIPKGPMTVIEVTDDTFWTECPVAFPVEGGEFDLAAFRIRDRATAETFVRDAIPLSEVVLP